TPRLSYEEFAQCLEKLLDAIGKDGSTAILMNPHRRESTEQRFPQLLQLSQIILAIGAERAVPVFDCNQQFKRNPNYEAEYFADTHHPNAKGNRVIAEGLSEFLCEHIEALRIH